MKKFSIAFLAAAVCCGVFADGVEFKLNKPSDWQKNNKVKWVGEKKDIMQVTGSAMLISSKKYDIDPKKITELEADIKMISGKPATTYFGFRLIDKNGRHIHASAVNVVYGSDTVLVKAVKPTDTTITVKANPKWKKSAISSVVIRTKKDFSDLPNYAAIGHNITNVKKVGDNMEVTFAKPFKASVPAGTAVRVHSDGGYMYTGGHKYIGADSGKVELKGKATGRSKYGMYYSSWAPGAVKAEVIMLVNWGVPGSVTQVKDVEIEIK